MVKAPRSQREAGVGRKKSQGKEKGERLKSWRKGGGNETYEEESREEKTK